MKIRIIPKSLLVFISIFLLLHSMPAISQDEDSSWWNEVHDWNGVTHWSDYIIYSPYYLGPNALSIPFSQKGYVKARYELQVNIENHSFAGDKTQNLFVSLYLPLVKNIVALEFYGVPIEHYIMDEKTVIERRSRNKSGAGYAVGDFYFSTIIQLLKNPGLAFRMAARTASGSKLNEARYTDAPGYFFDLSCGKDLLFPQKFVDKIRFHGMLGFYVWQMNLPDSRQNDAILYGFGVDLFKNTFVLSNAIDGYSGYFGNEEVVVVKKDQLVKFKDRPAVYRFEITKGFRKTDYKIGYQIGINDFEYQSIKLSFVYYFDKN